MPENSLPAAVFFDMDGLLVDSEETWYQTECDVMAALGGTWSRPQQEQLVGGPLHLSAQIMRDAAGSSESPQVVAEMMLDRMEYLLIHNPVQWMPGARDLLIAIRAAGIPCALVSASFRRLMDPVLQAVAADIPESDGRPFDATKPKSGPFDTTKPNSGPFDTTVAGDEVARTKPHPDPYLLAAERLGVDPQYCVVLEDSPTGSRAGLDAGCVVVAVPHFAAFLEAPRLVRRDSLVGLSPAVLGEILAAAPALQDVA